MNLRLIHFAYIISVVFLSIFFFAPKASAATSYFVATNGNDSNSGSISSPFLTVQHCVGALSAGDTCYIRAGTYNGFIFFGPYYTNSGTSWDNPITLKAYNHETVILQKSGEVNLLDIRAYDIDMYLIIEDLIFDGSNGYRADLSGGGLIAGFGNHVRVINCEIRHAVADGILAGGKYWELLNLNIYDNGRGQNTGDHGVYWGGSHLIIDGGSYHDNNNGYGIHIFATGHTDVDDNIVRNARIYNNAADGFGAGVIVSTGHRNMVYNNLIYNNGGRGVQVDYRCEDCQIYNNVIYGSSSSGIQISSPGTYALRTIIKNNIMYQNSSLFIDWAGSQSGTVISNNFTSNPSFVNAASGDFTLQSGSSAISYGANLTYLGIAGLNTDLAGNTRPSSAAWDAGAYQYGSSSGGPAADTTNPVISSITSSGITTSSVTISWSTDESSDTQIDYGTTASYGLSTSLNSSATFSHSQSINGLQANTLYHYIVKSRDAAGNLGVSTDQTFTTAAPVASLSLTFNGSLRDMVSQGESSAIDGQVDKEFGVVLQNSKTIKKLVLAGPASGVWDSVPNNSRWFLGATLNSNSPLLNNGSSDANFTASTFNIYASDGSGFAYFSPGSLFTLTVTFSDDSTAVGSVVIPTQASLPGDLNQDHIVNSLDWSIMSSVWLTSNTTADINHDSVVNSIDFSILSSSWLMTW